MSRTIALAAVLTLLLPSVVLAQDEEPAVTVVPNDQFCNLVAEDPDTCEQALTTLASAGMLPQAFTGLVAPSEATPAAPGALGDTQRREDVAITLADVAWDPESLIEPDEGFEHVSLLVTYEALDDVASSSPLSWVAASEDGVAYRYSAFGMEPVLVGGDVRADRGVVEGWVTFAVPAGTSRLEVSESRLFADPLTWVIER